MMKSLALNAIILYILFKSSVRDHILAHLPNLLIQGGAAFPQLWAKLLHFLKHSCRLSRRSVACLLFVLAIWVIQQIWQRFLNGKQLMSRFVERYLVASNDSTMREVDRKKYFNFQKISKKTSLSFNEGNTLQPLLTKSQGLVSHKLLQKKSRSLRSFNNAEPAIRYRKNLMVMGCIHEEKEDSLNLIEEVSPDSE